MNAQQIIEKQIDNVIDSVSLENLLERNIKNALKSGAFDSDSINMSDTTIARAILAITIKQLVDQFAPKDANGKKEMENLECFI